MEANNIFKRKTCDFLACSLFLYFNLSFRLMLGKIFKILLYTHYLIFPNFSVFFILYIKIQTLC